MGKNGIRFTREELKETACAPLNAWLHEKPVKSKDRVKLPSQKGQKTKGWISTQLFAWCQVNGLLYTTEIVFHPVRLWRFDWAVFRGVTVEQVQSKQWQPQHQVCAIEYEGIFSEKSGHTTVSGYTKDTQKYTEAAKLGWIVVRITATTHKELFTHLNDILNNHK